MMDELKPCPFCGGEASTRLFYKGKYRVHCNACDAHSGDVCDTEADAIDAWNTRAERTCTQIDVTDTRKPYTTHMTECSECGGVLALDEYRAPNYCPQCGAKVER